MRTLQEIIEDECIADDDDVQTLRDAQAEVERLDAELVTVSTAGAKQEAEIERLRRALRERDDMLADVMYHVSLLQGDWATSLTARYETLGKEDG